MKPSKVTMEICVKEGSPDHLRLYNAFMRIRNGSSGSLVVNGIACDVYCGECQLKFEHTGYLTFEFTLSAAPPSRYIDLIEKIHEAG